MSNGMSKIRVSLLLAKHAAIFQNLVAGGGYKRY